MKVIFAFVVTALLSVFGMSPWPVAVAQGTWIGDISSSNCGLRHVAGMTDRDCTLECIEGGAAFVLASNGEIYAFGDQTDTALRAYAGGRVKVTGSLKGNVLTAVSIERAPNEGSRQ